MKNFLKWGIFIAAANVVITLIEYFGGLSDVHGGGPMRWVAFVVSLGLLFWGILEKKKEDPGEFTFGKGWVEGVLISLIAGVILSIFMYIYFDMINPEMIDTIHAEALKNMAAQKDMTPEKIEAAKKFMDFMFSPTGFSLSTLFMYGIGGLFFPLIFSPIVKSIGGNVQTPVENA
jgi:hypothetical protein